ncbi:polyprenol reductase [Caerostris extrusa]|uniref:Polyprenal reductase n=1 Tax=Caerostris extrusa TaxID=172846 RepID=A0AAV4SLE2_CAEEX|nr:polyprenol reductase [Caerostris extrusa]
MDFNLLHFMWISYSIIVTFSGLNVLYVKNIPAVLIRLFTFGKTHKSISKEDSIAKRFEIPKRWFSHFYVFAVLYFTIITGGVLCKYFAGLSSHCFVYLLNLCSSSNRLVTVGFTFYFGVGLSLIHDAPGFERVHDYTANYISGQWLSFSHFLGVVLFFFAFHLQFESHKILASLRTTGNKVTSTGHHLPASGFFEYVSCPHYFAEILIYVSGCIILSGKSYTWWLVCLWTVCNQLLTGIMCHKWYKKTFKNYPVQRKAVIPFLI